MEWVNITAKSLPEAIDLALDNLGVDEAEAEIEVLEEPRQGLFGRTRGNARVRARVKPKGTRPKVERGRTRKRRDGAESGSSAGGSGSRSGEGGGGRSGGGSGASPARGRGRSAATTQGGDDAPAEDDHSVEAPARAESPRSEEGSRGGERGRGGRSSGRSRGEGGNGSANGRSSSGERQNREPVEEASVEEVTAQLETFLSGLTEAFGFDGGVKVGSDAEDGLLGMVEGRHGLMVGPRARTLDAIQELARVSVQRSAPSSIRIKVDVGGYRELRKEALRAFALEAAAAVRLDGRERSLEPMSSADRKIVHDTLSEEPGVETRSAGNEPSRRVVVVAAAGSEQRAAVTDDDAEEQVEADTVSSNGSAVADASDEVADEGSDDLSSEAEGLADDDDDEVEDDRVGN